MDPQHAPWAPAGALSVTVSNLPLEANQQEVAAAFRRAINVQVCAVNGQPCCGFT